MEKFDYVLKFLGPVELKFFAKELMTVGHKKDEVVAYLRGLSQKKYIKVVDGHINWIGPKFMR